MEAGVGVIETQRRRSHVAGMWGFCWLHADKRGYAVLKGEEGLRTINGFVMRIPSHYITVVFRRQELKP